jgi:beta-glucosidase
MNIPLNTVAFDHSKTSVTHRNSDSRSQESAQRKPSGHRSLATFLAAISLMTLGSLWVSAPAAIAADEVCSSCGQDVRVNGEFAHRKDNGSMIIQGAPADNAAAFREEINGKNFTVTIAHLPAGRYTISIGEVENQAGTAAGDRVFDVTAGDVSLAKNFDIFAAAGGAGKVTTITGTVQHQDDEIRGPISLAFSSSKDLAKFNTVEIKNAAGTSVIAFNASELADNFSAEAKRVPDITEPAIWRDPSHPLNERINDLIRRMSLAEKVGQLQGGQTPAPAIARLGLPSYAYWNEALHGVANDGIATVFPEPVGGSCSWDPGLFHQEGTVIGIEGRAKFNDYASKNNGNSAWWKGLTFWTPNINIFRDPRWGRGQETYGEDPFLTGTIAVDFVQGIQGDDPNVMLAMACAKHYAVHSGPEALRHSFDAEPSARDLYETYLPQFEMAVRQGHIGGVMGAYSALYGIPDCASSFLLTDLLRTKWGFEGYVVSDCGAIGDISGAHRYARSQVEAAADAVKAGCNLTCGGEYNSLVRAVQQKLLTEKDVDQALYYTLWTRFKLGLFDPSDKNPYSKIGLDQNDTAEHRALALKLAEESIVLLKNDGILPLDRSKYKRIAVIGPNASATDVLHGNYNGTASRPVSVLNGIRELAGTNIEVTYAQGSVITTNVGRGFGFGGRGGGGFGGPLTADQSGQLNNAIGAAQTDFTALQDQLTAAQKDAVVAALAKSDDNAVRAKLEAVAKIQTDIAVFRYTKGVKALAATITADQRTAMNTTPAPAYDALFVADAAAPGRGGGRGFGGRGAAAPARPPAELQAEAISNAMNADLVIYVGGINPSQEGEQHDRDGIELPQVQEGLVQALAATGKPVVMVNCSGSDVAFPWEAEHLPAILQAWYPGEEGGRAVGEILFGDVNPSGHLTVTFYTATTDLPAFTNYAMINRTYRYYEGKPLYAFGHGLSYTEFDFSGGKLDSKITADGTAKVTFTLKNTGKADGDEVAQVYFRHVNSAVPQPKLALCGFTRVHLKQGESREVTVEVPAERLRYWDTEKKQYVVEPGNYEFLVGAASDDIRLKLPMAIAAR